MLFLLFALSACDMVNEPVNPPVVEDEDNPNLYVTLTLTLPNQASETRSSTTGEGNSNEEPLDGQSNENTLNSATLYLYETTLANLNKVILVLNEDPTIKEKDSNDVSTYTYTLTYKLPLEYVKTLSGKTLGLGIVGNEGNGNNASGLSHDLGHYLISNKKNMFDATFSLSLNEGSNRPIGDFGTTDDGQIMPLVNKTYAEVEFPIIDPTLKNSEIIKALQGNFTESPENTFHIHPEAIELERAVARIDYADGSNNNFTYEITSTPGVKIKLAKMQVFNVSPKSYLFRHTAEGNATGILSGTPVSLFEDENGQTGDKENKGTYTWIVSPELGQQESTLNKFYPNTFEVNGDNGKISTSDFASRFSYRSTTSATQGRTYYPWCYVSENTLSGYENLNKDKVPENATGILFSFEVQNGDSPLKPLTVSDVADDHLPNGITKSKTEGKSDNTITITDKDGYWIDVEPSSDNHYYLKYYAFLKHNNPNTAPEILDPMEYAVVRNNVYQVSVTGVTKLFNPESPLDYYLSLDIKVLAWAKRDISVTW